MKIEILNDVSSERVFGLLAGEPGVGKTSQAVTFKKEETLIFNLEKGLLSLKGSGYAVVNIKTVAELEDALKKIPSWVKFLFIDSLSEVYDLVKEEVNIKYQRKDTFAKFDELNMTVFHIIRLAKSLPIDCMFTCHVKKEKDGLAMVNELAFDGKMPSDLKKHFDLVVHMKEIKNAEGNTERVFMTSPSVSNLAKKRVSPWLKIDIKEIEKPNLGDLVKKLKGV